jgi:hypothetical protein
VIFGERRIQIHQKLRITHQKWLRAHLKIGEDYSNITLEIHIFGSLKKSLKIPLESA